MRYPRTCSQGVGKRKNRRAANSQAAQLAQGSVEEAELIEKTYLDFSRNHSI